MTNEEYHEKVEREREESAKIDRQNWMMVKVVAWIICLTPGMWLLLSHYQNGDLEIYLEHNAYAEHYDETYTRIYATRYTWWGLGSDRRYEIKSIKGKWHIREAGETEWTLMDFDGLGMAESDISEPFYSR